MALSRSKYVETLLINRKELTDNVEATLIIHLREMTLKAKTVGKELEYKAYWII